MLPYVFRKPRKSTCKTAGINFTRKRNARARKTISSRNSEQFRFSVLSRSTSEGRTHNRSGFPLPCITAIPNDTALILIRSLDLSAQSNLTQTDLACLSHLQDMELRPWPDIISLDIESIITRMALKRQEESLAMMTQESIVLSVFHYE
jgi:hypothetical protein